MSRRRRWMPWRNPRCLPDSPSWRANNTAILISHRFSTVRKADRIVVLEGGKIREQGTHDQLVTIRGRYARLFELQAANYR